MDGNSLAILKKDHPRIIPMKFGEILPSGLRGDGSWRTKDGQRTSCDHNSSPWAYGSGELKRQAKQCLDAKIIQQMEV